MARYPVDGKPRIASGYKDARRTADGAGFGHLGADVAGGAGTPVLAPEAGVVVDVYGSPDPERDDNTTILTDSTLTQGIKAPWNGYGPGGVVIQGDDGWCHLLAHLATQTVAVGDRVAEGEQVGTMATHVGNAGSHTHWEVRRRPILFLGQDRVDNTIDPVAWVAGVESVAPSSAPAATAKKTSRLSGGWLLLGAVALYAWERRGRRSRW